MPRKSRSGSTWSCWIAQTMVPSGRSPAMDASCCRCRRSRRRSGRKSPILWASATTKTPSASWCEASDVVDEGELGHAGQRSAAASRWRRRRRVTWIRPSSVPVVQHALGDRRLGDRGERRVLRHRAVVVEGVDAPHAAHELAFVAVGVGGQVAAHRRPGVAAVVAAPHALGTEVEAVRVVRADQERRVPVPALRRVAGRGLRLDVDGLVAAPVDADELPSWVSR